MPKVANTTLEIRCYYPEKTSRFCCHYALPPSINDHIVLQWSARKSVSILDHKLFRDRNSALYLSFAMITVSPRPRKYVE